MKDYIKLFLKEIETTMACASYAEAGEACPMDDAFKEIKIAKCKMSFQDTMSCSSYAEAGVSCPICEGA